MKTEKMVLTVLCAIACAWVAKMVAGVAGLARHQDIPALPTILEFSMFISAGLLPLLSVWFFADRKKNWLYVIWTPCIFYVSFLALNYIRVSASVGIARLFLWSAIIILFIRASKKTKPADPAATAQRGQPSVFE